MKERYSLGRTLYGNPIPDSIVRKAERRFSKYAAKFGFDPEASPSLVALGEGRGFEDFGIRNLLDAASVPPGAGEPIDGKKGVVIGTIRMGFGHCRMAIAIASAARSLGHEPYWLDLMSFPDSAASKTIKYLEDLYNLGSRISQRSKFFNKYVWEYVTGTAAQRLTFSVEEDALSRLFVPLYRDLPKDIPFFSTHPWTGHAAVNAGLTDVVTIVPDNFPLAFHVVEGSCHAVQSPSSYMGYRSLHSMGGPVRLSSCMPESEISLTGHYVDHEIVAGLEGDCEARLERMRDRRTRRFLLTMGGAGAQVRRFAAIARTCRDAIDSKRLALFINMGDHKGRWADLEAELRASSIPWTLHTDWAETRSFVEESRSGDVSGIHVFLHDDFFSAVYSTNLLMRVSDVMITKPSELSFYPVPKLFIQRVGRHEAWGAIRGSEIGDGTIETASETGLFRTLKLLIEEDDLGKLYNANILRNWRDGVYDGAYNAVKLADSLRRP